MIPTAETESAVWWIVGGFAVYKVRSALSVHRWRAERTSHLPWVLTRHMCDPTQFLVVLKFAVHNCLCCSCFRCHFLCLINSSHVNVRGGVDTISLPLSHENCSASAMSWATFQHSIEWERIRIQPCMVWAWLQPLVETEIAVQVLWGILLFHWTTEYEPSPPWFKLGFNLLRRLKLQCNGGLICLFFHWRT